MAWIKQDAGKVTGFAAIAPPSSEVGLWTEVAEDDPLVQAFLHPELLMPTLAEVQQAKIAEFDRACTTQIMGGFDSAALGATHHYGGDAKDQDNLIQAVVLGLPLPYTCTEVATGMKQPKLHTPDQMRKVLQDGAQVKLSLIGRYHQLCGAVRSAQSTEAVGAIGW